MAGFRAVDPKQSFPELEERILERWRERDVFRRSLTQREGSPVWSFYEGPPTANGRPGSHHVLSRAFKDIYPRFQTMRGHHVPRKAGWDCHGLPVELEVEKELGITSKAEIEEYGIAEFNQRCRESVFRYVDDWNRLTERIGFWIDLDDPYVTLENDYIESVWWSLRQHWDAERLYEKHKVVPYCPRCGTALSSHEVASGYKDIEDPSVYVRMPVQHASGPLADGDALLIWTTTPWTLPGNVAVAVAPNVAYVRARVDGESLVLAEPLVERVLGEGVEIVDRFPGSELVGQRYESPVFRLSDREPGGSPILAGDFVTTEEGTGLVHIAPAFGDDDFNLAVEHPELGPLYNPVNPDGTFDQRVTDFEGRFVKDPEVTQALIDDLEQRELLFRRETIFHAYPHCWRCETPLLYYAKSSWYIRTTEVKDRLLAENESIGWHPEHIKHGRFGKWLEGNVDWALSRERYWGTPLPIWECGGEGCEERFCAGSVAELRERAGEVPDDLHRPYIDGVTVTCESCGGEMRRVKEVIDTWYDSGAMPFAQFHYPFEGEELFAERFPADFICEAIDQTRGWFYSLLAESVLLFDRTSYRNCVCLGLILDPEGQKMSKSRGNVVEPDDVISRHGADAFRWYYLSSQQPWSGYRFSVDTVGESVRQFLLTLWNTYSFWVLYANAEGMSPADYAPGQAPEAEATSAAAAHLDRWAISRLQATTREAIQHLEALRLHARRPGDCGLRRRALELVRAPVAAKVLGGRSRRIRHPAPLPAGGRRAPGPVHPVHRRGDPPQPRRRRRTKSSGDSPDSVHLRDYPEPDTALEDAELEAGMEATRRAIELGRAARSQAGVKVRQPLRKAVIVATGSERAEIEALSELVAGELNVKELEFVSEEAELVSYEVKPNYRSLGPRFGKLMPQAAAAVESLDPEHVSEAAAGEVKLGIQVDGTEHELAPEDVSLVMKSLPGYQVEAESGRAVALALELDDELVTEGLAREIVHAIQGARRDAGLEVTDRISLSLSGDPGLLEAARAHEAYVAGETLAGSVSYDSGDEETTATIEGRELRIGCRGDLASRGCARRSGEGGLELGFEALLRHRADDPLRRLRRRGTGSSSGSTAPRRWRRSAGCRRRSG